jgi:hypothetical protein
MAHKLKALGVGLLAMLSMGAVATASHAANFTASSYPAYLTSQSALGNDTIKTEAGTIECKSHFQGSLGSASSVLAVIPSYSECKAFGFLSATVGFGHSCNYVFNGVAKSATDLYSSWLDIQCAYYDLGKKAWVEYPIVVTAGSCEMRFGSQWTSGSVLFVNHTAFGDMTMQFAVTEIDYEVLKDGFGCPFSGTGAKSGATYSMHSGVTLDSNGGQSIDIG